MSSLAADTAPRRADGVFARLASSPGLMAAALLLLTIVTYLPGVVWLPAVDRTEIVFADTTRDMVARGDWLDPRYHGDAHAHRPIGTFWAQGAVAELAQNVVGDAAARSIITYRLAGLIAVVLAVLACFYLLAPLVGTATAGLAAALFAVAPLTVLVAQLAIAEGLSLLPAAIAMLALMRIYTRPAEGSGDHSQHTLVFVFWAAIGASIAINALLVPVLVLSTLAALWLIERDLSWLRRLFAWQGFVPGLAAAALLAAPWLIVRAHQDGGVPFSGLGLRDTWEALTGSQDMKLRAWPGTFVLAAVVGFLPGTALLPPAMLRLWQQRTADPVARFLLAWIVGYLAYNELLSSEPGTYTVQVIFPAMAAAVALVVMPHDDGAPPPRHHIIPHWPVAALFALALFGAVYAANARVPAVELPAIVLVAVLFATSAAAGRAGQLRRWAVTGVAALSLFAITLLAIALPRIDGLWPSREMARAIQACPAGEVGLVGFTEPSGRFLTGATDALSTPDGVARASGEKTHRLLIVESQAMNAVTSAISAASTRNLGEPDACFDVFNSMRGCPLRFGVFQLGAADRCKFPAHMRCSGAFSAPDVTERCRKDRKRRKAEGAVTAPPTAATD